MQIGSWCKTTLCLPCGNILFKEELAKSLKSCACKALSLVYYLTRSTQILIAISICIVSCGLSVSSLAG